jgi:nuclear transport factor 2 (NTF2) superfamily protein
MVLRMQVEPLTVADARRIVAGVEAAFASHDVDRMLAGFSDGVVVRFAEQPEMRGKAEVRQFLESRMRRQQGYRLQKTFRALTGNVIANEWTGHWTDAVTGKRMHGYGAEFWTMDGELIAVWDAAFNVWEEDGPRVSPVT